MEAQGEGFRTFAMVRVSYVHGITVTFINSSFRLLCATWNCTSTLSKARSEPNLLTQHPGIIGCVKSLFVTGVTLYLCSAGPVKRCRSFVECLAFVQHCDGMVGLSALKKVKFTLRVQWAASKWHHLSGNHDDAIQALTLVSLSPSMVT